MKGCFSVCPSFFPSWLCVGADSSWLRACSEGDCPKQDLIIRQEEVHRHVVGLHFLRGPAVAMPPFGGNPGFIKSWRDQLPALSGDKLPWDWGAGWGPPSASCWWPASVSWWAGRFGGISAEPKWTVAFAIPALRGDGFPTFCFWRAEGKHSQLPELSLHHGRLSLASSIAPPPLIDFWFLRAVTPLQLFHNSAAASKEKEKVAAGRMHGSQQKDICSCLLGAKQRGQTCCSHTCCWEGGWLQVGSVKPQGFGGSVCEKPVDQHRKVKAIPGTLFVSFWSKFKGSFWISAVRADGKWWKLENTAPGCFDLYVLVAFSLHQNLPA